MKYTRYYMNLWFGIAPRLVQWIVVCLLFSCAWLQADTVHLNSNILSKNIAQDAVYSTSPTVSLDAFLGSNSNHSSSIHQWNPVISETPNFGFSKESFWFLMDLANTSSTSMKLYAEVGYPHLDEVDFHLISQGNLIDSYLSGDRISFLNRRISHRNFIFPLKLDAKKEYQLLVRVKSNGTLQVPITLWDSNHFWVEEQPFLVLQGVYFGGMLVMILYNLFLFFSIRELNYLVYVALVASSVLFVFSMLGFGNQYVWPNNFEMSDWVLILSAACFGLSAAVFSTIFLGLKENLQYAYKSMLGIIGIYLFFYIMIWFTSKHFSLQFLAVITLCVAFISLVSGCIIWKRGNSHAKYFTLAWGGLLSGATLLGFNKLGWIPRTPLTENSAQIGSIMEVVLLSFALGYRINKERALHEKAQRTALHNEILARKEKQRATGIQLKAKEEELISAQKIYEAESSSKAKSLFLATMSHEIRTPMNGVLGMTQLLRETQLDTTQHEYLDSISASGESLLAIISDILDYSKIEAGKMTIETREFDLLHLITECTKVFSLSAAKLDIDFEVNVPDSLSHYLMGDSVRLKQIILNLLSNAFKFTKVGSVVLNIEFTNEALHEGEVLQVMFSIKDSGIGIEESVVNTLFEAFSQADTSTTRVYGGTGLGLSITKKLCSLLGGDISVESSLNKGSCFSVQLPFLISATPISDTDPSKKKITSNIGDTLASQRILIVEDNHINRIVLDGLFNKMNIKADMAENGEQALNVILEASSYYDIIFMDCEMPVMDGYEASKKIREHEVKNQLKPAAIIALTAHAFKEYKLKTEQAGMNYFMTKPINIDKLKKLLLDITSNKFH